MGDTPGYVAPAGWYVDPAGSPLLRWWSGLDWTEHLAPLTESRAEPTPAEAADAGTPDDDSAAHPLTRRERRMLEERAAATLALPPPVTRIAPITSYGWDRETERPTDLPLPSASQVDLEPADLYRDIPGRWSSASVWVIAFMPWITVVAVYGALVLVAIGSRAWWWELGSLVLPYLLTVAAAQRDVRRLRSWRHTAVAHWAWSLLGAPVYLIARTVVLRRHAGLGSAPLWVWLVNLVLVLMALAVVAYSVGLSA